MVTINKAANKTINIKFDAQRVSLKAILLLFLELYDAGA